MRYVFKYFRSSHFLSLTFLFPQTSLQIVIQKQSLTCESKIEVGYYNPKAPKERLLKTDNICVHCSCTGSTDFLFGLEQLQEKNMIDGWPMLPICDACMKAEKKLVKKNGKQDKVQQRRERVAKWQEASTN